MKPAPAERDVVAPCEVCGCGPALTVQLFTMSGVLWRIGVSGGSKRLCRSCGLAVFRANQARALLRGWLNLFGVVVNQMVLGHNIYEWRRLRRLPPPMPPTGEARRPLRTGRPLLTRTDAVVGIVLQGAVLLAITAVTMPSGGRPTEVPVPASATVAAIPPDACFDVGEKYADCGASTVHLRVHYVRDPAECPASSTYLARISACGFVGSAARR